MEEHRLTATEEAAGLRLDAWLAGQEQLSLSRSQVQRLIVAGQVSVNGAIIKKGGHRIRHKDIVSLMIPSPVPLAILAEPIPLNILYEDRDLAIVDKPHGMVTHPAAGHYSGTLVNALLAHMDDLSGINGVLRPGIVHRLDKDTSGLIMVAKTDPAHRGLASQLQARQVERRYLAVLRGKLSPETGKVEAPLGRHPRWRKKMAVVPGGKEAITHYCLREAFSRYSLTELELVTGRTHQIRVHMAHIGHPVLGDPLYGPKKEDLRVERLLLHAWQLSFIHPINGQQLTFTADIPSVFQEVLQRLRLQS